MAIWVLWKLQCSSLTLILHDLIYCFSVNQPLYPLLWSVRCVYNCMANSRAIYVLQMSAFPATPCSTYGGWYTMATVVYQSEHTLYMRASEMPSVHEEPNTVQQGHKEWGGGEGSCSPPPHNYSGGLAPPPSLYLYKYSDKYLPIAHKNRWLE